MTTASRTASLAARAAASPFLRALGLTVDEAGADHVRLGLEIRPGTVNRNRTLHGGAIASLLATASRFAALPAHGPAPGLLDLGVVYLAVGRHGPVSAEGRVLRRGRAIVHAEATVVDAEGDVLARSLAVLATPGAAGRTEPRGGAAGGDGGGAPDDRTAGEPPREPLPEPFATPSPFSARLGVGVARREAGRGIAVLRDADDVRDADGAVDAGALATLLDAASGASAWSRVGFDPRGRAATLAMHLVLHASAHHEDVVADAVALPAPGCHVCSVRLWGRRSRALVASGTATYRITLPA